MREALRLNARTSGWLGTCQDASSRE
jgi:hypothetical protein